MGIKKFLKKQWERVAPTVYKLTSKKAFIKTKDLFDTPNMTKYHHVLSALRYLALEEYYGENDFGISFYIKANQFGTQEAANEDIGRYKKLIKSIEERGYDKKSYIYVDKNGTCFNGTHRLALCCYFNIKELPAVLVKRRLNSPTVKQMQKHYGLSDEEFSVIEDAYKRMISHLTDD